MGEEQEDGYLGMGHMGIAFRCKCREKRKAWRSEVLIRAHLKHQLPCWHGMPSWEGSSTPRIKPSAHYEAGGGAGGFVHMKYNGKSRMIWRNMREKEEEEELWNIRDRWWLYVTHYIVMV